MSERSIDEAWTLVLEHYHDELPPEFQWRPNTECHEMQVTASGGGPIGHYCVKHHTNRPHEVPRPELTDAAAMAVLRVLLPTVIELGLRYDFLAPRYIVKAVGCGVLGAAGDPRDAIILAAAELAKRK